MKHIVRVEIEVDPAEYEETEDTADGAVTLVEDMLRGRADIAPGALIECGGVKVRLSIDPEEELEEEDEEEELEVPRDPDQTRTEGRMIAEAIYALARETRLLRGETRRIGDSLEALQAEFPVYDGALQVSSS